MKPHISDSASLWNFNISGEQNFRMNFKDKDKNKKEQSLIYTLNLFEMSYLMQNQKKEKAEDELKSDEPTAEKDEVKKAEQKTMEKQKIADRKKKEDKHPE